jgi:hypothetical protein
VVPIVSGLTVSPSAFAAAPGGPSALTSTKRRSGARVNYTLNEAADVSFKVVRLQPKRKARRRVTLRGSFAGVGGVGANSFRFSGRLAGSKLKPGRYELLATPSAGGKTGQAAGASFRILG